MTHSLTDELAEVCGAFLARYDNDLVSAELLFSDVAEKARAALARYAAQTAASGGEDGGDAEFLRDFGASTILARGAKDDEEYCRLKHRFYSIAATLARLEAENEKLRTLINCPHNDDWFEGVRIEAAHQQERWGVEHDAGKEPQDWFWLVGYLGGKCLRACIDGNIDKATHHTISTAAVLLNWYRRIDGQDDRMRPGIETPAALTPGSQADAT